MSILDQIIETKVKEVALKKADLGVEQLERKPYFARKCISLVAALNSEKSSGIIAEFKRKSPSKGYFKIDAESKKICHGYQKAGAAALSILTDSVYFGGKLEDLESVRDLVSIPILRKDFIVDEYQLIEAKAAGADVILLIAAAIPASRIFELARFAKSLALEVLLEVHNDKEVLEYCSEYVDLVGVNNRNLKTFETNIALSEELSKLIPRNFCKIAESGLKDVESIKKLQKIDFKGFLIGETFMKESEPDRKCAEFVKGLL